ncbi:MAG: paraquat-inducible protein A [Planctomycetes bacterium]|nr:paraquat-inducible protein A [Planctomycetota bacterium]
MAEMDEAKDRKGDAPSGPYYSLREIHPRRLGEPLALLAVSILLAFGLYVPLLKIEKMIFWENEYSVATGVFGLWGDGQFLLAAIVFFWSVAFPIAKLALLFWIWFGKMDPGQRERTLHRLETLGKWSMLDVYIVAVLIVAAKLGPVADVTPEYGIYVFGGAVVTSMLLTAHLQRLAHRGGEPPVPKAKVRAATTR